MKKAICLRAVTAFLLPMVSLASQADTSRTELEPVVVSATRFPGVTGDSSASLGVISAEEIESSGATHIVEVLRGRGGIQITDLYGDGSRATVSMRGFGGNAAANTLILVDGRRLNNSDLGSPDLNSVDLKDVERVEILRGSAGALYGDQAVGGVINIITRAAETFSLQIEQDIASYRGSDSRFSVANRFVGGASYRLSGSFRETDNYRDNNHQRYGNLLARIGHEFERGDVFAEFQQTREELRLPGSLFDDEIEQDRKQTLNPDDFLDTDTDVVRVAGSLDLSESWVLRGEVTDRWSESDGLLTVTGFGSSLLIDKRHRSVNPRLQGRLPFGTRFLLLTMGLDWEWTEFELESAAFGVTDDDQRIQNFYVLGNVPLAEHWSLDIGGRHARVRDELQDPFTFPAGVTLKDRVTVGNAGLMYAPASHWRLFFRVDENYRFPKADENSFVPFGVVGLKVQEGFSREVGWDWTTRNLAASAVLYQLDIENEINFDPVLFANNNLDDTRRRGLILNGEVILAREFRVDVSYGYVESEFTDGLFQGEPLPFVAPHSLKLTGEYRHGPWLSHLEMHSISDRRAIGDYDGDFPELSGYTVWNLFFGYRGESWEWGFTVNNLTDKAYRSQAAVGFRPVTFVQDTAYFPAPERNFRFNLTYHID